MGSEVTRTVDVPGHGPCLLPREFSLFTGDVAEVEVRGAREAPRGLHARLAAGAAVVLTGSCDYVDAVFRYCQRHDRELVRSDECGSIPDRVRKRAALTALRRQRLHRLLVLAQGEHLVAVEGAPDLTGLQEWLEQPTGEAVFLLPVRRLQRILTDMRRAREGLRVECLGGSIAILPHVYVPADGSVPAMLEARRDLLAGQRVLDMGTGTGVLALLAAKLGARHVVATDSNPKAVANARLNVERFRLGDRVEVRGPAHLFEPVKGERFDVVLFNAPWIEGEPQTLYDTANYDPGYRVITAFVEGAPAHLAEGGAILLQYSDASERAGQGSLTHLDRLMAEHGLRVASKHVLRRVSRVLGSRERVFLFEIRRVR